MERYGFELLGRAGRRWVFSRADGNTYTGFGDTLEEAARDAAADVWNSDGTPKFREPETSPVVNRCFTY